MLLYHGSNIAVEKPQIIIADRRLDFGAGFYLTSSYEQAARWADLTMQRRGNGTQIVSVYELDEEKLNTLFVYKFEQASVEWLKFVSNNRNDISFSDNHDIVIGPVANDRTMPVLRRYFSGVYTEEEAIRRLLPQKLKDQYAFKTEKAISILAFKEAKLL
ncbi:MAG: DUF3990 domain-containing protein [Lachnospiraceae bacterium]|nr:DUF3990 domain-containing protein [Lachnospiraceae bacterium]